MIFGGSAATAFPDVAVIAKPNTSERRFLPRGDIEKG
jgi:hypothetical protein